MQGSEFGFFLFLAFFSDLVLPLDPARRKQAVSGGHSQSAPSKMAQNWILLNHLTITHDNWVNKLTVRSRVHKTASKSSSYWLGLTARPGCVFLNLVLLNPFTLTACFGVFLGVVTEFLNDHFFFSDFMLIKSVFKVLSFHTHRLLSA